MGLVFPTHQYSGGQLMWKVMKKQGNFSRIQFHDIIPAVQLKSHYSPNPLAGLSLLVSSLSGLLVDFGIELRIKPP